MPTRETAEKHVFFDEGPVSIDQRERIRQPDDELSHLRGC
jgi:hypothetical protein